MITLETHQHINWFRNAAPYINAHRGKTFVLALTGDVFQSTAIESLAHDIALLNSLGTKVVLVHGARPQIEARLADAGLPSQIEKGYRVTNLDTLEHAIAAANSNRTRLEALFSMGLINSPMHGLNVKTATGNFVTAQPLGVLEGVDYGHTGTVRSIDSAAILEALDHSAIVLISTLGYSPTGEIFNVTLDNLIERTIDAIDADKLVLFCHPIDSLRQASSSSSVLHPSELQSLLPNDEENSALLKAASNSCQNGVSRAHVLDYSEDGALLQELFTRFGSGVLVQNDDYESNRSATIEDVGGILELIRPLEQDGSLVTRSRELLEQEIHQFQVMEIDGMVIGCAALYPYPDEDMGEIACVAIHADFRGDGRASTLLNTLEQKATQLGLTNLFTLSTQTSQWFVERGYAKADLNTLPAEKMSMYNMQRNSNIFIKSLL